LSPQHILETEREQSTTGDRDHVEG